MDFTGERLVPDQPRDDDLYHEHIVRYQFAAQWAQGRRVLDAGCGAGYGAALLAASGAQSVLGVDIAPEAIAYARAHYSGSALSFAVADVAAWDGPTASFDLVVSFEVIEHLEEPASLVAAARRLLAPGGLFIVSTPNVATYPPGNPFHRHEMTLEAFQALLSASFPTVTVFAQDYSTALALRPHAPALVTPWRFVAATQRTAREPDYFVALCADSDAAMQPGTQSIMYELPADRLGERIAAARTLQQMLDDKNRQMAEKDAHIARIEQELERQGAWATEIERRLRTLSAAWYVRLFGRLAGRR